VQLAGICTFILTWGVIPTPPFAELRELSPFVRIFAQKVTAHGVPQDGLVIT